MPKTFFKIAKRRKIKSLPDFRQLTQVYGIFCWTPQKPDLDHASPGTRQRNTQTNFVRLGSVLSSDKARTELGRLKSCRICGYVLPNLENLSLLPTCGIKFYKYGSVWEKLYSENLTDEERAKIIDSLHEAIRTLGFNAEMERTD